MLTPVLENIPQELKDRTQWVVWRIENRDGKPTKIPYNPVRPTMKAKANEPATWGTYDQAVAAYKKGSFAGIGYEFSADDPFTGIDLDRCINSETGAIETWAKDIVEKLQSYTEISPSGRGLHILIKGKIPEGPRRKGQIEMYDSGRFFTITGVSS